MPPYWVPIAAPFHVPDAMVPAATARPLTAVDEREPPETVPPEMVAVLMVEPVVTAPSGLTLKFDDVIVRALPDPTDQVDAAAPVRFSAPDEVSASVPELAVEMVRLPALFVHADVPPEASVKAPVELPIEVAPVADVFR